MKNLTESSTFATNVSVPEDNVDLRTAASVETPFQALANRTKFLKTTQDTLLTRIDGNGDWIYPTPLSHTVRVCAARLAGTSSGYADATGLGYGYTFNAWGHAYLDLNEVVPSGCTITKIDVRVKPGAARSGTNRMNCLWVVTTGDSTSTISAAVYDDTTSNAQTMTSGTISLAVDRTRRNILDVMSGNTASSSNDFVLWIDITFTDLGPRNF